MNEPSISGTAAEGRKNDLGLDVRRLQFARFDFRRIAPEGRRLGLIKVAHHHPVQLGQGLALEARILAADGRILPHDQEALDLAGHHIHEHRQVRMVAGDLGMIVIAVVIVLRRGVAELRLEVGDGELGVIAPVARRERHGFGEDKILQCLVRLARIRHVQVARAASGTAWRCRSNPGSRRGRAAPARRRRACRCCRAAPAASPPQRMICTPTVCCVQPTA